MEEKKVCDECGENNSKLFYTEFGDCFCKNCLLEEGYIPIPKTNQEIG